MSAETRAKPVVNRQRRLIRRIVELPAVCIVGCLALVGLIVWKQERIIFPGSSSQGKAKANVTAPAGTELVTLKTRSGDRIVALFGPALTDDGLRVRPDAAKRPTLLYFYGNGMWLREMIPDDFNRYRALGANVLIPDYAGYGMSGGAASEKHCYETADAAYDYLLTRRDVDPRKIVAAGWSLGGAVAIDLASRRQPAGLITVSTFTCLCDVAMERFPTFPFESRLLRHKFESESKIGRVTCPMLLGHGKQDAVVPFSMRDRLAASAKSPVEKYDVEDGTHGDMIDFGGPDGRRHVRGFLESIVVR